ncbi:MAG: hypothetical protein KF768_06665 [Phycisphaeraceae bacterium]|nr:hypothetical protein [Phycisphaeraceae bacterium]
MNVPGSASGQLAHQTFLYRKALHPELFALKARRVVRHNDYELEVWLTPGGHVARFKHGTFCCCELVTDSDDRLPVEGAVTGFPCSGEHEFEHRFVAERVTYIVSVQTETLSENLYSATYDEMTQFAKETGALVYAWSDSDRTAIRPMHDGLNGSCGVSAGLNGQPYMNGAELGGRAGGNGWTTNGSSRHRAARGPGNLSLVDIQKLSREVHCQSYHLIEQSGLVLRTQTIFEHA